MTARGQPDQPRSARYILKDYVNVSEPGLLFLSDKYVGLFPLPVCRVMATSWVIKEIYSLWYCFITGIILLIQGSQHHIKHRKDWHDTKYMNISEYLLSVKVIKYVSLWAIIFLLQWGHSKFWVFLISKIGVHSTYLMRLLWEINENGVYELETDTPIYTNTT